LSNSQRGRTTSQQDHRKEEDGVVEDDDEGAEGEGCKDAVKGNFIGGSVQVILGERKKNWG
jgi:hypothetical protein